MARPWCPITYWFESQNALPEEYRSRFLRGGRPCQCSGGLAAGPVEKKRGLLIAPFQDTTVRYVPAVQRWDRVGEKVWIGVDKRTTPADLVRPQPFDGKFVRMGDGNDWLVPVANPFVATCSLPFWEKLDWRKRWVKEIQDNFKGLADRAAHIAADMRAQIADNGTGASVSDSEGRTLIADALACNYDVTLEELSALRVFSESTSAEALLAVIDWNEIERVLLAELGGAETGPFGDTDRDDISPSDSGDPD